MLPSSSASPAVYPCDRPWMEDHCEGSCASQRRRGGRRDPAAGEGGTLGRAATPHRLGQGADSQAAAAHLQPCTAAAHALCANPSGEISACCVGGNLRSSALARQTDVGAENGNLHVNLDQGRFPNYQHAATMGHLKSCVEICSSLHDEIATQDCLAFQAPVQASPLPKTPAAALIQSLLRSSASLGSPMEGVPERAGPVLQPKTPAFVSHMPTQ